MAILIPFTMVATIAVTITTIIRTDTGTGATTDIRAIGIIGTTMMMIDLFSLVLFLLEAISKQARHPSY
jgi:hypothetical protein